MRSMFPSTFEDFSSIASPVSGRTGEEEFAAAIDLSAFDISVSEEVQYFECSLIDAELSSSPN